MLVVVCSLALSVPEGFAQKSQFRQYIVHIKTHYCKPHVTYTCKEIGSSQGDSQVSLISTDQMQK